MFSSRRRFLELTAASATLAAAGAYAATPVPRWADLDGIGTVAEGYDGAEGPTVLPDGHIVFVARPGSIFNAAPGAPTATLATALGTVVGTALDRKQPNILYVCRMDLSFLRRPSMPAMPGPPAGPPTPAGILRLDLQTNRITQLYSKGDNGNVLMGPNKLIVDEWDDIWFTDVLAGAVYWARSDGSEIKRVVYQLSGAHGICRSPDGRTIYVGSDNGLVALAITGRGSLAMAADNAQIRLITPLDRTLRADGFATEAGGNIVIACWDSGLLVVSPEGEIVSQTKIPGFGATNLAFGGTDGRRLYLTVNITGAAQGEAGGKLISMPWPRAGLRLA